MLTEAQKNAFLNRAFPPSGRDAVARLVLDNGEALVALRDFIDLLIEGREAELSRLRPVVMRGDDHEQVELLVAIAEENGLQALTSRDGALAFRAPGQPYQFVVQIPAFVAGAAAYADA